MDVRVHIGGQSRSGGEITPKWITEQINTQKQGGPVCVRVELTGPLDNLNFATPPCGGFGGGRVWTEPEQRLIDLWRRHRLDQVDFPPGGVVAFLQQVGRLN
jgi:hypothetical protein